MPVRKSGKGGLVLSTAAEEGERHFSGGKIKRISFLKGKIETTPLRKRDA